MRNLYVVRHGKPEFPNGEKCCIGWTDLPLSEEGRRQMEEMAKTLETEGIERIYTSPLKRCMESAQIISGGRIPIEAAEELKEIGMGAWEGLPFSVIRERYPQAYEERGKDIAYFCPQGGESFTLCQKRVVQAFRRIRRETRGNVILMAHAGVNRALISYLENRNLRDLLSIPQEYADVYTHTESVYDALIVAAGRSSRMGAFKPLLALNGKRVLDWELDTLRQGGAREIVVVTGRQKEDVEEAVRAHSFECSGKVTCLHNPDYAENEMFDSVCLGLRYFLNKKNSPEGRTLDGIFFLPVDVPLFTRFTMECEKKAFSQGEGEVFCPCVEGSAGHPLLIRTEGINALLAHHGERGLQGACERLGNRVVPVPVLDLGVVLDADTPEEFSRLEAYQREREIPDAGMCQAILCWFQVKEETRRHSEAVGRFAKALTEACNQALKAQGKEAVLNPKLSYAAGLLHDVAKGKADHASEGARWLSQLGHKPVAELVNVHMDLPDSYLTTLNEGVLVYLADKMMAKNVPVTVEERFAPKREKFKGNPRALSSLEKRYQRAKQAEKMTEALIGSVYELACTSQAAAMEKC